MGSCSKERCGGGGGKQKDASGGYRSRGREEGPGRKRALGGEKETACSYRSRGREEGPGRKRAVGGGARKQQEAIEVGVVKKVLVEREPGGEQREAAQNDRSRVREKVPGQNERDICGGGG